MGGADAAGQCDARPALGVGLRRVSAGGDDIPRGRLDVRALRKHFGRHRIHPELGRLRKPGGLLGEFTPQGRFVLGGQCHERLDQQIALRPAFLQGHLALGRTGSRQIRCRRRPNAASSRQLGETGGLCTGGCIDPGLLNVRLAGS